MTWRALLEGDLAARASRAAADVAAAIDASRADRSPEVNPREAILDRGDAGLAVALAHLAPDSDGASWFLDRALVAAAEHELDPTLYRGIAGIGWAADHLRGPDDDDPAAEVDEAILAVLQHGPALPHDLIEGVVGHGIYALSRLPRPIAAEMLDAIVGRLDAGVEWTADGATWWVPPKGGPEFPEGSYHLGLARGQPGQIALLAAVCARGLGGARARELLEGAVAWLLAQRIDLPDAQFPAAVAKGSGDRMIRHTGWCYGDTGIAIALLAAARALGRADWEAAAIDVARRSAHSPLNDTEMLDANFCHGAAGVGHLLNRLHQLTGDPALADDARRFYARALDMQRPDRGAGGFPSYDRDRPDAPWKVDLSLLYGAAGAALALHAAAAPHAPTWDRLFVVDLAL